MVSSRKSTIPLRRFTCAAQMASAMVKLLPMRTAGVEPPSTTLSVVLASREGFGVHVPVDHVGGEQAAEEHDLGDQEQPHPERGGLLLLLHRVELMGRVRGMR